MRGGDSVKSEYYGLSNSDAFFGSVLMHTIALAFLALAGYLLIKLAQLIYWEYTSPLKRLPGPKSTSWIYGNLNEILESVPCFHYYCPRFKHNTVLRILWYTRNGHLSMALRSNIKGFLE